MSHSQRASTIYTLRDYERDLSCKTTLQLVDVLRTKLVLGHYKATIIPEVDALVRKDLMSTLMLLIDGPNTRVPINRKLPPELLRVIFDHVRLQPCKRGTPGTSIWDPVVVRLDWLIRASHVCRYWRTIIVDDPALWNRIDDPRRHLMFVSVPVERARMMPLAISIKGEPTPPMRALLEGSKPVREIRYDGISVSLSQKHLQRQAPFLENLSLTGTPGRTAPGHARRPSGGYPVQIFRGYTPNLHRLALESLNWLPTLQMSSLTHLCITDCYGRTLLQRILSLLSVSQNLTDLVLVDRGDVLHSEGLQLATPVHPRHLERLVFKNMSSAGVTLFLTRVRLKPETSVRLVDVRPLSRHLLEQLSRLELKEGITKLFIKGSGTRRTVVGEGPSTGILIDHFVAENEDWGTALPRILPMDKLRELHVTLRDSPALFASTPTAMFDFLHQAPALERIYVDTEGLISLLDALECCGRGKTPKLACPDLVLHVQMPCRGSGSSTALIQSFATRQTNLGIRRLVAEYCPGCQGVPCTRPWFSRDIQVNFESVTSTPKSRMGHEWRMLRTDWPAC
ncbi:uncharacterized protein C8Q71DRAFT_857990 [Rhodofomes roseus]|uniref:F-box domain-containing protein n=1 Tax=Rhodofomes roseus TaxID=34475 RepID=A0ABQ8KG83_9APHY|nr:uncharacterized protein C8Q71DRAFT_857990 [Rhodofomes roseus]KAH9836787.1 hypothetical protein C8Q71DRAFT_857990 [Rhodofomes roseus]